MGSHELRDQMEVHLRRVREAARDNEFIDIAEAERIHQRLQAVLDAWHELTDDQRRILRDAVSYLVRTSDHEDDLRSPIGFEDDAKVVDRALDRIKLPGQQGRDSGR